MIRSILSITATVMLFSFSSVQVHATTNPVPTFVTLTSAITPTKAEVLVARLNEIKATDKTNLTAADRKALRNETKTIKSELRAANGGVYLSAGAIILIVILLIILL